MRALLGERRIKVLEDQRHGWRVEGLFEVPLMGRAQASRPGPPGCGDEVVAGGRSVRLPTRGITRLQPEWVWAA
jgi:hypothetical protein